MLCARGLAVRAAARRGSAPPHGNDHEKATYRHRAGCGPRQPLRRARTQAAAALRHVHRARHGAAASRSNRACRCAWSPPPSSAPKRGATWRSATSSNCQRPPARPASCSAWVIRSPAAWQPAPTPGAGSLLPGDMPTVQPSSLLAVAAKLPHHVVVYAQHRGRRGHPVGFSAELYSELVQLSGDEGARAPGGALSVAWRRTRRCRRAGRRRHQRRPGGVARARLATAAPAGRAAQN